jgi:hypothetical protein
MHTKTLGYHFTMTYMYVSYQASLLVAVVNTLETLNVQDLHGLLL